MSTLRRSSELNKEMASRITVDAHVELDDAHTLDELERVLTATLSSEGVSDDALLALILVDDAAIAALNEQYRGVAGPTDVLAFGVQEGEAFVSAPEAPMELGDIVISIETAQRQADSLGHGLSAELALLAIHGCLHLLGYDHDDPGAQAQFWRRQSAMLTGSGYPDVGADRQEMHEQSDEV